MSPVPKDPNKRIQELRDQIRRADRLYYNLGQPELTDAEYDALFVELRELEEAHPKLRTADSPTVRVGAPLPKGSGFTKVQHLVPMLSIESLQTEEDVKEFDERARRQLQLAEDELLQWTVEPKFDGVSANLLYEDGKLSRGLSRGDGVQGEDITQNLRTIRNLPLELTGGGPFPPRVEVRGEVILSTGAFERLRQAAETTTDVLTAGGCITARPTVTPGDPIRISAEVSSHRAGELFALLGEKSLVATGDIR